MKAPELVVVGTGILPGLHITREAEHAIATADRVLFLVADPITTDVLMALRDDAESLEPHYWEGRRQGDDRSAVYERIVHQIVSTVEDGDTTCAVFYGHPGVFSYPGHEALRRARAAGFAARMAPAVSAEDCLFCELGIDPSTVGIQSYEATHLINGRPSLEPKAHLVVWQVGGIGRSDIILTDEESPADGSSLETLQALLLRVYPPDHQAVLYLASTVPGVDSAATPITVASLSNQTIPAMATLYVEPLS